MRACWCLLVLLAVGGQAAFFSGSANSVETWKYVARFAFLPTDTADAKELGTFHHKVRFLTNSTTSLAVYYSGYKTFMGDAVNGVASCAARLNTSKFKIREGVEKDGLILKELWRTTNQDTVRYYSVNETEVPHKNMSKYTEVESYFNFHTSSVRWYFVALATCDPKCQNPTLGKEYLDGSLHGAGNVPIRQYCSSHMDVKYELRFTNGRDSSRTRHYSANEIGVLETYATLFCLQATLVAFACKISWSLLKSGKFHHTVRLLDASVVMQWLSTMSFMIYWAQYGDDGKGWLAGFTPSSMVVGYIFQAVADTLLVVQCVLICKGWTIVRTKISASGRVKITVFITLYAWVWLTAILWNLYIINHLEVVYFYDCFPGKLLIALRFLAAAWLIRCARATLLHYASKKRFLKRFTMTYVAWLVGTPVAAFIVNHFVDEWVRQKAVLVVELGTMLLAQAAMLAMYNPNQKYNKSFPFHRMTSDFQRQLMAPRKKKWGSSKFGSAAAGGTAGMHGPGRGGSAQPKRKLTNEEKAKEMAESVSRRLANWKGLSESLEKDLVEMGASRQYDTGDTTVGDTPSAGARLSRVRAEDADRDPRDQRRGSREWERERDRDVDDFERRHRDRQGRDRDRDRDRDDLPPMRPTDRDFR